MRINITDKKNFIKMFNSTYKDNPVKKINGITTDSRKVMKNDIFFPIKGENFDGHNFINNALSAGAICFSEQKSTRKNIIYTKSIINEINAICKKWKKISKAKIIGITGSNGKTTTKDLLYHIFKNNYSTSKTIGNFNSSIGFPISFLSTKSTDDFCILEYGASKPKEIKNLCDIISPDISYITNVSKAHIENFKSFDQLYETKLDLYKYTKESGKCFINTDNITIDKLKLKSKSILFDISENTNIEFINDNNDSYLKINNKKIHVPNHLTHIIDNILATCIISKNCNINDKKINNSLKTFNLPSGRGNIIDYSYYKIIDDSYNANPVSTILAINRFCQLHNSGKKILVIGDMLELGEDAIKEHENIAYELNKSTIDVILTYGTLSSNITKNIIAKKHSKHYTDKTKLKIDLNNLISKDDIIYLKGSRSMQLEKLYLKDS